MPQNIQDCFLSASKAVAFIIHKRSYKGAAYRGVLPILKNCLVYHTQDSSKNEIDYLPIAATIICMEALLSLLSPSYLLTIAQ